jgi:glycosyltransferase involved in cell wall biosynthesis
MNIKRLTIIIPVYNEEATLEKLLRRVCDVTLIENIEKELIVIDDCSTDNSVSIAENVISQLNTPIRLLKHEVNKGKGAAIHTGIKEATGEYVVVQDADLEYDPNEFNLLLQPVINANADVVYGSRFIGGSPHRILFFWHSVGNRFLTFLSNIFTNLNLTDMETCYKLIKTSVIQGFQLKESRFGFEPEVTAKISKVPDIRIYEVGVSYYGRTYDEGKKINWKDGLRAIYCIFRYNIFK